MMCGIAGVVTSAPSLCGSELHSRVSRMTHVLRHRGPDDAGVWTDIEAGVALGHRRLAIVDLSADGHQPMVSAAGRLVIVFNGEIYNFLQLRRELEEFGSRFR